MAVVAQNFSHMVNSYGFKNQLYGSPLGLFFMPHGIPHMVKLESIFSLHCLISLAPFLNSVSKKVETYYFQFLNINQKGLCHH